MTALGERRASATDAAILDVVRRRTETTRIELAQELAVTPATITNAVKRLLASGLVVETGHAQSTGGKRASLLRLNDRARWSVGCTVEEDRLAVVAVDMTGALRSRVAAPLTGPPDPTSVSAGMRRALATMEPGQGGLSTTGIGLALPESGAGAAAEAGGELAAHLEDALGVAVVSAPAPVCAALGSAWSGELPDEGLAATVHLGAGIATTLLRDGRPVPTPLPGSLAHLVVDPEGPACPCGARGCLGAIASAPGLVARAREAGLAGTLGLDAADQTPRRDAVRIALAAAAGDATALDLVDAASAALAEAVGGLAGAIGLPEVVVTGAWPQAVPGLVHRAADLSLSPLRARTGRPLRLAVSQVQPQPEAVGAAVLALQTFLEPRLTRADP